MGASQLEGGGAVKERPGLGVGLNSRAGTAADCMGTLDKSLVFTIYKSKVWSGSLVFQSETQGPKVLHRSPRDFWIWK